MKKKVIITMVVLMLLFGSLSAFARNIKGPEFGKRVAPEKTYAPGGLIVMFQYDLTQKAVRDLMAHYKLKIIYQYSIIKAAFVEVPRGEEKKWIAILTANPKITGAKLNGIARAHNSLKID